MAQEASLPQERDFPRKLCAGGEGSHVFNQPNVTAAVIRNFVSLGSKAGEISTRRLEDRKPRMGY